MNASVNDIFIERHALVSSKIKIHSGRSKLTIAKDYCVLGIYEKSYNKWLIYEENKAWGG